MFISLILSNLSIVISLIYTLLYSVPGLATASSCSEWYTLNEPKLGSVLDNRKAEREIEKMERQFDRNFKHPDFANYFQYESYLRTVAIKNPLYRLALHILDSDQIAIATRQDEKFRDLIAQSGIKNVHSSGYSVQGHFIEDKPDPEFVAAILETRHFIESFLFDETKADYIKRDNNLKPKYGFLRPHRSSGLKSWPVANQFGFDIYTYKYSSIQKRLGFFFGDSLNETLKGGKKPKFNQQWFDYFIPWSRRLVMVPYMIDGIAKQRFDVPRSMAMMSSVDDALQIYFSHLGERRMDYWESAVLGKLDLNDLESFEFGRIPPSGPFLKALRDHKIEIFDGRTKLSHDFHEPAPLWTEK